MQELKAQEQDLQAAVRDQQGYRSWLHCAQKKGYSGVGVWSRIEPENVVIGFGSPEFDAEGRYVRLDFKGLSVISVYFPSGTSGDDRQEAKYRFLSAFEAHVTELRKTGREIAFCGDVTDVVFARLALIHLTQDWSDLPNWAIRVGMARIEEAKIGGIEP